MRGPLYLLAIATAACLAQPATAELKHYRVVVEEFTNTPGVSPMFKLSDQFTGQAIVRDTGNGAPVLVNLRVHQPFEEIVSGPILGPGWNDRTFIRTQSTDQPAPTQAGLGTTSTTIDWGLLSGWTKTGFAFCQESPVALLNVFCLFSGWVSGVTLVPPPSYASAYDTGVWTFTSDMSAFNGPKFMYQTFVGGSNNTQWRLRGELVQIPALPLLGAGALGAALVYLGVRAVRGTRR